MLQGPQGRQVEPALVHDGQAGNAARAAALAEGQPLPAELAAGPQGLDVQELDQLQAALPQGLRLVPRHLHFAC